MNVWQELDRAQAGIGIALAIPVAGLCVVLIILAVIF